MSVLEALIQGIVQGLTEFLPVSSSGHLVVLQKLFGIKGNLLTFDLVVHFGTLIAVCAVMWKEIAAILKKPLCKMTWMIVAATIPTVIIGFAFKDLFKSLYESGITLGFEFILTGLVLWLAENTTRGAKGIRGGKDIRSMNVVDALVIGTAQGAAILPAVSRSGLTIAGALFRKLDRELALRFSFLLSIPAILGPVALDAYDVVKNSTVYTQDIWIYAAGFIAAAISGYAAIRFMLRIFTKASFKLFSAYVFIIGALVLIDQIFFGRFFGRIL